MDEHKQLETLKKNILRISLAHEILNESHFSKGVHRAITEIVKNTGLTTETLKKELKEKGITMRISQNDGNKEGAE